MISSKTLISDYVFNSLPYLLFDLEISFKLNQFVTICHFLLLLFATRSPPLPHLFHDPHGNRSRSSVTRTNTLLASPLGWTSWYTHINLIWK